MLTSWAAEAWEHRDAPRERMLTCLISHSSCLSVLVVFAEACRVTDQPSLFSPATQAPVSRGYEVETV